MKNLSEWFNYEASLKILIFALLAGAALPGLFALGLRLHVVGGGQVSVDGATPHRNPLLLALSYAIFALVIFVIVFALLYISRDFLAHQTGHPFLGAKPK